MGSRSCLMGGLAYRAPYILLLRTCYTHYHCLNMLDIMFNLAPSNQAALLLT